MSELSVNHLLGIKYITEEDIQLIFETADHFKEVIHRPIKKVPSLRDITIANLFFENSTRTRLSFELAEKKTFCGYYKLFCWILFSKKRRIFSRYGKQHSINEG